MKFYNSLLLITSLLTISPFNNIVYGNSKDTISITLNTEGLITFQYSYYKDDIYQGFEEDKNTYQVKQGDVVELNLNKEYTRVIIEVFKDNEYLGEADLDLQSIKEGQDYEVLISDKELFEDIDLKYIYTDNSKVNEIQSLRNHYVFRPLNQYVLPKIIELEKLQISIKEEYLNNGYNDCYLLLNHGLKGSDFSKSEEDFYKVPLICEIKDSTMSFSLENKYYYDFNTGTMKNKKTNNCVEVKDLILSKSDLLLTEGYLIIEKFGYYQTKFQLDLLLEEKPLFGKNGYYSIKKID